MSIKSNSLESIFGKAHAKKMREALQDADRISQDDRDGDPGPTYMVDCIKSYPNLVCNCKNCR